jgi:hypothetical protein
MAGDAVLVDEGEAEATFARSHDQAVHGSEGVGEGANGILSLNLSSHVYGVPESTRNRGVQNENVPDQRGPMLECESGLGAEPVWNTSSQCERIYRVALG